MGIKAALAAMTGYLSGAAKPRALIRGTGKNIDRIFIHCSATREGRDVDANEIRAWHKLNGWNDIGYHFVIRLDGRIERGRAEHIAGAHVAGFNKNSIGVCYVGGLALDGASRDTRTEAQKQALADLVRALLDAYPGAQVLGHRDIWPKGQHKKDCPCFDVGMWWKTVQ